MQEYFTYADLTGRRKLRRYIVAAMILVGLIMIILGWSLHTRQRSRELVFAPPQPVDLPSDVSPGDSLPAAPGRLMDSAPKRSGENGGTDAHTAAGLATCPINPEAWTFLDVLPGDNYKRIQPMCVYAGLARTVAWHLLERLGYSKVEAAERLGFSQVPWQPMSSFTALTNSQGPLELRLRVEWPDHPEYRYWVVSAAGKPGPAYSLRGCYRTRTVVGDRAERWNADFPVLCAVAVDTPAGWSVSQLGVHLYAHDSSSGPGSRAFLHFGYSEARAWVFVGERQDLHLPLTDAEEMGADRIHTSAKYGAGPWDAVWLAGAFGLTMRPLPEGWQEATDPAALEIIGQALEAELAP